MSTELDGFSGAGSMGTMTGAMHWSETPPGLVERENALSTRREQPCVARDLYIGVDWQNATYAGSSYHVARRTGRSEVATPSSSRISPEV